MKELNELYDVLDFVSGVQWKPKGKLISVHRGKIVDFLQAVLESDTDGKNAELYNSEFVQFTVPIKMYRTLLKPFCEKSDLREEFIEWAPNKKPVRGKVASKGTLKKYIQYLSCIEMPVASEGKKCGSGWNGVIEFVTGSRQQKEFYEVTTVAEFDAIFGVLGLIFEGKEAPSNVVESNYNAVLSWASTPYFKHHSCFPAAYSAYREFLEWREAQKKPEDKKDELPPNIDRLSIALKLFAEKRSVVKPGGWDSYDAWTKSVRSEFVAVDESLANGPGFDYLDYIRKYSVSGFVANTSYASHSENEKRGVLRFLKEQFNSPKPASWYIDPANRLVVDGNQVKGMSPKAMLYFMSELHPEEFAAWTEPTYEQLEFLGLHKGAAPSDLTIETYEDCKAKQQLIVAKMKELKIGKATDDPSAPDYRTANEFLWWLGQDDSKNLIKENVMNKLFKSVSSISKPKGGNKKLAGFMNDELLKRLAAALRTKPFAILAGHSGTGKSRLVRKLAYMTCADEGLMAEADNSNAPGNYCMVQVRPNWHDSTDLLGYYSEISGKYRTTPFVEFICKAYAYPDIPFFVCLDEMNLAPVEQYFAEYLSAIESADDKNGVFLTDALLPKTYSSDEVMGSDAVRFTESKNWFEKYGLTIPKNLFVVGTVNMDDTTCQFSRKVLDRAMTILMDKVDFDSMKDETKSAAPGKGDLLESDDIKKFLAGKIRAGTLDGDQVDLLKAIDAVLGKTPFAVAYRFANEYALYEDSLVALTAATKNAATAKTAMDECVLMKVLPRIHGEESYVKKLFMGEGESTGLKGILNDDTLSGKKMKEIIERKTTYLSFWP